MLAGEEERLALLNKLTETIGADAARTIMESLPPMRWDQIATKEDLRALEERLVSRSNGEFTKVDGQFAKVYGQFDKVYGQFAKVDGEFVKVYGELAELRGEIRELRGAISLEISKQTRTLLFTMVGFALTVWISIFAIGIS